MDVMGSAQSRNERRRASNSIDNERSPTRRRLDSLRRVSTLGRGNAVTKRDRGQSIEPEAEEREKRQRTGSSSPSPGIEVGENSGGAIRTQSSGDQEQDPLALERTQSIETIRQVLGSDWTPPWPRSTSTTDPATTTTTPNDTYALHISAPTSTPASNTVPGPPVRNPSTHTLGHPGPTPPTRLDDPDSSTTTARIPIFLPTPNLQRRWSASFTLQPLLVSNDSESYVPLERSRSQVAPLRLLNDDRGHAHYPQYYRDEVSEHLRILSNQRLDMRQRFDRIRAAMDRSDPQGAAEEAESARRALGLPRSPPTEDTGAVAGGAGDGASSPGAILMIQGLAQMQSPPPQETAPRRRFGRRDNASREHVSEQANLIANLLT